METVILETDVRYQSWPFYKWTYLASETSKRNENGSYIFYDIQTKCTGIEVNFH